MTRKPLMIAAAAAAVLLGGLAVSRADDVLTLARLRPAVDEAAAQDRLLAKAAFTEVLAGRAGTLGMKAPIGLAPYAPIYPNGMIFYETEDPASDHGGQIQYAAAAPLRATLDFYEDAAALHGLPFTVAAEGPDTLTFRATDGSRKVVAKLTRQFENGTQVDLAYE